MVVGLQRRLGGLLGLFDCSLHRLKKGRCRGLRLQVMWHAYISATAMKSLLEQAECTSRRDLPLTVPD